MDPNDTQEERLNKLVKALADSATAEHLKPALAQALSLLYAGGADHEGARNANVGGARAAEPSAEAGASAKKVKAKAAAPAKRPREPTVRTTTGAHTVVMYFWTWQLGRTRL